MTVGSAPPRPREAAIVALACVTLAAYGSWIYSFGVILDDLTADLGASESSMVAAFGAAQLLAGAGSVAAGRLLDRRGSRPVFVIGMVGALVLAAATLAGSPLGFGALFSVGAGIVGATGFYHISQTAAARVAPGHEAAAITRLTLYAAFSSPIFYPLSAWLVERSGWRLALQAGAAMTLASFVAALSIANSPATDVSRTSWRLAPGGFDRRALRFGAGVVLATGTIQLLSVYQVPVMSSAGLGLATASTLAGARGIMQFFGRLPLTRVAARFGAARTLRSAILMLAVGTALLAGSGWFPVALVAMTITGLSIGAQSPLVGIRGREVFGDRVLGTSLGTVTLGTFVAGAVTPVVAGTLVESTGSRMSAVVIGTVIALGAAIVVGGDE